jgi:hypothetical protein
VVAVVVHDNGDVLEHGCGVSGSGEEIGAASKTMAKPLVVTLFAVAPVCTSITPATLKTQRESKPLVRMGNPHKP